MTRIRIIIILASLLVVVSNRADAQSGLTVVETRAISRILEEGDRLQGEGRYQEAANVFRRGLQIRMHWVLLLRVGAALRSAGECEEALGYFRLGLSNRDETFTDDMLPRVQEAIDACEIETPSRISVISNVTNARVEIDDQYVGTTPLDPVVVEPGERLVTVQHEGHETIETTVLAVPSQTTVIHIDLNPIPGFIADVEPAPVTVGANDVDLEPTSELLADSVDDVENGERDRYRRSRRRSGVLGGILLALGILSGGAGGALIGIDGRIINQDYEAETMIPGIITSIVAVGLVTGGIVVLSLMPREDDRESR